MKEYQRDYPGFALCGLNCGLCPRYHTAGKSRCPGCGGPGFHLLHPACSVISCSRKHGRVEFCFQCRDYPCERFRTEYTADSFITYQNLLSDLERARTRGIDMYRAELEEKVGMLEYLLENFNDGRRKNFYCIAVNLLKLEDLRELLAEIKAGPGAQDIEWKDKIAAIISRLEQRARTNGIELKLRKSPS